MINKQVAQYWKEHYDLLYYLQKNWSTVGPKLVDKLYFFTGDVDTYYLNNSTQRAREVDEDDGEPALRGFFMYGDNKPHCWSGPVSSAERLKEIAQFIAAQEARRRDDAVVALLNISQQRQLATTVIGDASRSSIGASARIRWPSAAMTVWREIAKRQRETDVAA